MTEITVKLLFKNDREETLMIHADVIEAHGVCMWLQGLPTWECFVNMDEVSILVKRYGNENTLIFVPR